MLEAIMATKALLGGPLDAITSMHNPLQLTMEKTPRLQSGFLPPAAPLHRTFLVGV
jgi:hypothetical protein